jgi:hypothetical protein
VNPFFYGKRTFGDLLERMSVASREFATRYVTNELPSSFQYFVYLSMSYDKNPLKSGERVFPDVASHYGERIGPISSSEAVELLWNDGLIPRWIDISVVEADAGSTYFLLLCCGRYTSDEELLYYSKSGQGPFGIKSPPLPGLWKDGQEQFDINTVVHKWPRFA